MSGDHHGVSLLGWLWLLSPFVLIGVISHDSNMRELISAYPARCHAIGWCGALAMLLGAALVPGTFGTMLFGIGTPLVGLIVWTPRDDGGGGGDGGPDVPPDWDDFERAFRAYSPRDRRPSDTPHAPLPR
jgi:hypothetical protein